MTTDRPLRPWTVLVHSDLAGYHAQHAFSRLRDAIDHAERRSQRWGFASVWGQDGTEVARFRKGSIVG